MTRYEVVYRIGVEAESPEEAARAVRTFLRGERAAELLPGADTWEVFDTAEGDFIRYIDFENGDVPLAASGQHA